MKDKLAKELYVDFVRRKNGFEENAKSYALAFVQGGDEKYKEMALSAVKKAKTWNEAAKQVHAARAKDQS
jgi:hypothetical protein